MEVRKIIIGVIVAIILLLVDMEIAFYTRPAAPTQTAQEPQTVVATIATTSTRAFTLTPDEAAALSNPDGSLNMDRVREYLASSTQP